MKKNLCSALAILLSISFSHAQTLTNKKGFPVLPEKNDWSVGIDLVPVVRYAGNLFYANSDSTGDISPYYPFTFFGKYMVSDKKAIRAHARLGFATVTQDTLVPKASSTNPNELVSDEAKRTVANILLGAGVEWRKGKGRVNGIYGVEGVFLLATDKTKYTYGNELDVTIQSNFQTVSVKQGTKIGVGARGFLGIEYFVGAKLALSAEYGWGPAVISTGRGATELEVVDGNTTKSQIIETSKSFAFGFDNDMNGGTVALNFYF